MREVLTTLGRASKGVHIREVSLYPKSHFMYYMGWYFALGMDILSLFANCRYIRSRY